MFGHSWQYQVAGVGRGGSNPTANPTINPTNVGHSASAALALIADSFLPATPSPRCAPSPFGAGSPTPRCNCGGQGYRGCNQPWGNVTITAGASTRGQIFTLSWDLVRLESLNQAPHLGSCKDGPGSVPNSCSIQIHSDCPSSSNVGAPVYSESLANNPWQAVIYSTGKCTDGEFTADAGVTYSYDAFNGLPKENRYQDAALTPLNDGTIPETWASRGKCATSPVGRVNVGLPLEDIIGTFAVIYGFRGTPIGCAAIRMK